MKLQKCVYRTLTNNKVGEWQTGIAVLPEFNGGSVHYILSEEGKKIPATRMWTYTLIVGPLSYIDTEYKE